MIKYNLTEFPDDQDGECPLDPVNTGRTHVRFHSGKSIWASRSFLEKVLAVLCLVLLAIVVLLMVLMSMRDRIMYLHIGHGIHPSHKDVCLSRACVDVAASILSTADFSADPCQDFYQYACGGWVKANPIPHGQSAWGTFQKLWQQNQLVIKNVLESPPEELANDAERKAQTYYRSCMDANGTTEERGGQPLLDLIDSVGGWNITTPNWSAGGWDFQQALQKLHHEFNAEPLFTWGVVEDDKNSSSYVIQVNQGRLTLPSRDYYINKTTADDYVLGAYLEYLTQVGVLLGGKESEVRRQANDVISLETELAEITTPADERRDEEAIYHKMTIPQLQDIAPLVDWSVFFQDAFDQVNVTLPQDLEVVVCAPEYLKKLCDLLKDKYLSTLRGKVTLNNFMMTKSGGGLVRYLSKAFRNAYKMLQKALVGTDEEEETWRSCVDDTNTVLGFASGAMFVRQNFRSASKKLADEMIKDVRAAFIENTKHLSWMDEETREKAEDKAQAISRMMGFPPSILEADYLNDKYALLEVNEDEYFENIVRFSKYTLIKSLMKYGQPVNKTRWDMTPQSVNAYYSASHNMIVFPAGILQAPFYDPLYPRSLNFGAMGVVMGHELTHAFDDQGREYDKYGNLNQWWNNATIDRFKERTACMVDQYSKYKVGNLSVNGRQTLGENIADNGGLKASFDAYRLYRKAHGEEVPLPGVNLTHSQLFFLSFSQVWCSAATPEAERVTALNDGHAPARYRVIGTLSNSKDFAREYHCPMGSDMNPANKCQVW